MTNESNPLAAPGASLRWLGVGGLELTYGLRVVAVDPFVTRPPMRYLWNGRVSPNTALAERLVPRCDLILISHAHFDHVMDVPAITRRTGALVVGSANTCTLLRRLGVAASQLRQVGPGERLARAGFEVTVWPGDHPPIPGFMPGPLPAAQTPPLRLRDYRMDVALSYHVACPAWSAFIAHSQRNTSGQPADLLAASIAQPLRYYQELVAQVRPRLLIPLHWDDFFQPLGEPLRSMWAPPRWAWPPLVRQSPLSFSTLMERIAPEVRVLALKPLQEYDLGALLT